MQVNSNTILVKKGSQEFIELENILLKVASANDIKDVSGIDISLDSEAGIVSFKQAAGMNDEELAAYWKENNLPPVKSHQELMSSLMEDVKNGVFNKNEMKQLAEILQQANQSILNNNNPYEESGLNEERENFKYDFNKMS